MNDFFAPWIALHRQAIEQHKANVDNLFRQMDKPGFGQAAQAAREVADAQIDAWEKWLALWGPRG